jgi:hypothetical protein
MKLVPGLVLSEMDVVQKRLESESVDIGDLCYTYADVTLSPSFHLAMYLVDVCYVPPLNICRLSTWSMPDQVQ